MKVFFTIFFLITSTHYSYSAGIHYYYFDGNNCSYTCKDDPSVDHSESATSATNCVAKATNKCGAGNVYDFSFTGLSKIIKEK